MSDQEKGKSKEKKQKKIERKRIFSYLWKWTNAFALSTDSFLWRISQDGSDQRNRPSRSMFPACCRTSQTQATWSWVNPKDWKGMSVFPFPPVELEPCPSVKGDNPDRLDIAWWPDIPWFGITPDPSDMCPMIMIGTTPVLSFRDGCIKNWPQLLIRPQVSIAFRMWPQLPTCLVIYDFGLTCSSWYVVGTGFNRSVLLFFWFSFASDLYVVYRREEGLTDWVTDSTLWYELGEWLFSLT